MIALLINNWTPVAILLTPWMLLILVFMAARHCAAEVRGGGDFNLITMTLRALLPIPGCGGLYSNHSEN